MSGPCLPATCFVVCLPASAAWPTVHKPVHGIGDRSLSAVEIGCIPVHESRTEKYR